MQIAIFGLGVALGETCAKNCYIRGVQYRVGMWLFAQSVFTKFIYSPNFRFFQMCGGTSKTYA